MDGMMNCYWMLLKWIRIKILWQMLYIVQCLPVKVASEQLLEWEIFIARYLSFAINKCMLQLRKEKVGMGLPWLQDTTRHPSWDVYALLAHSVGNLVFALTPRLGWGSRPLDNYLQRKLEIAETSWQALSTGTNLQTKDASKIMRWCAYDSDSTK